MKTLETELKTLHESLAAAHDQITALKTLRKESLAKPIPVIQEASDPTTIDELMQKMAAVWEDLKFPSLSEKQHELYLQRLAKPYDDMLESEPIGAGEEETEHWNRITPLKVSLLTKWWNKANPEETLDLEKVELKQWKDHFGDECNGMKHKDTGKMHGVVRVVKKDDWIEERCYNQGVLSGLFRAIYKDEVIVRFYREDLEMAYFDFDRNLKEKSRYGKEKNILDRLTAMHF